MATKIEEIKNVNKENMDFFRTCEDSYTAVSKMWEDSCLKLYKPWFESTEAFFGKAFELSKDASPETHNEFYSEWLKTSQNSFGKFYQIPTLESNKETFEKLLVSAEESKKIYGSWIAELEENSRATREVLTGEADPVKYKEVYDMWINSYGKMLNELLTLYSEAYEQISKIWKDSYTKLYLPYTDSMQPSREVLEYFLQSENGNLNLYKSWMEILGQMSQKAQGLSKEGADPEAYRELYNLWGGRHLKTSLITHPHSALLRRSWSM